MLLFDSKGFVPQDKKLGCGVVSDIKSCLNYFKEVLDAASERREFSR